MYSYLTGSASWFVLTMLTQVFGVKGKDGDLLIAPKLVREQFQHTSSLSVTRTFLGRQFEITFLNARKLEYGAYKIIKVSLNSRELKLQKSSQAVIDKGLISRLALRTKHFIDIELG